MYMQPFNNNYMELQNLRDKIDKQMQSMQQPQMAPINNYITTSTPNVEFEARYLKDGEEIQNILIKNRTIFIDEKNKLVQVKELDGTISKTYNIIVPKDAKDLQIEELQKELEEMRYKYEHEFVKTIDANEQPNTGDNGIVKPTTKKVSK